MDVGSPDYELLRRWIAAGAPLDPIEKSRLKKLTVTPSADSAVGKFVQSGEINVEMKKWKVAKAEGILNLVPPSFLPLVDPKIVVSYTPEDMGGNGISAVLDTKFPAPMAKNGELGNFRAGYEKPRGLFAHVGDRDQFAAFARLKRLRVCLGDSARSDECKFKFFHKNLDNGLNGFRR